MRLLADALLDRQDPLASLLLADPANTGPDPVGPAAASVPVLVADAVAESFFARWPVEDFDLGRDLGDLTPRAPACFVEMGRPSRIFSAAMGVNSSAHLPRRWGWRACAAGRSALAAELARGVIAGSRSRFRDYYDRLAASGLVDVAAVEQALDAPDPCAAGRALDGHSSAALTAAGIEREFGLLKDPNAAAGGAGRLAWLLHLDLVIDGGERIGGPVATADLALGRDGRLILPPLVDSGVDHAGFRAAGVPDGAIAEYPKLVLSLLFPALLALAYLSCEGIFLRPREPGLGPAQAYILDPGGLMQATRN